MRRVPGAWAGARQRKSSEAAAHGLLAQSQAAGLLASTEKEAKMPKPAGQGLGEAGAGVIHSGWAEVDPGVLP